MQHGQVAGIVKSERQGQDHDYLFGLEVVEAGRIEMHRVAAYDSAFQVLVSIGVDHKSRVYCREAWPYALSNPVFDPATVYGLKGNTVKVRLTGQEGKPCPGWWVHWYLGGLAEPLWAISISTSVRRTRMATPGICTLDLMKGQWDAHTKI